MEEAFELGARGLHPWPDPHSAGMPAENEYSRLTDPARWRIVGARADAWMSALARLGGARVVLDPPIRWRVAPRTIVSRSQLVVPVIAGALPLVFCRSRLGDVVDAGVTLGVGDPAVCVVWFPDCGCDACDSGSQNELDHLDEYVGGIVWGTFRHVSRGDQTITVTGDRRRASNVAGRGRIEEVLADPRGWHEVRGRSWFDRS